MGETESVREERKVLTWLSWGGDSIKGAGNQTVKEGSGSVLIRHLLRGKKRGYHSSGNSEHRRGKEPEKWMEGRDALVQDSSAKSPLGEQSKRRAADCIEGRNKERKIAGFADLQMRALIEIYLQKIFR